MYFLRVLEPTAIISLYSNNGLVFITEAECLMRGAYRLSKYNFGKLWIVEGSATKFDLGFALLLETLE
jgi:hypothetical protein